MGAFASAMLFVLIIGAGLGAFGQLVRAVLGLSKAYKEAGNLEGFLAELNGGRFLVSMVVGAVAGILAAMTLIDGPINRATALAIVGAGFAGADAIESMMALARRSTAAAIVLAGGFLLLMLPSPSLAALGAPPCLKAEGIRVDMRLGYDVPVYPFRGARRATWP